MTGAYEGDFISGLGTTQGQTLHPDGSLLVGLYGGNRIDRFDETTGAFLGTFASGGGLVRPNNFVFQTDPIPEPATGVALLFGLYGALLGTRRRRGQ